MFWSIKVWAANHMAVSKWAEIPSAAVLQKLFDFIPAWIAPDRHTKGFWTHIHLKHIQYISTSHCIWQCWILIKTWLKQHTPIYFQSSSTFFPKQNKVPMFFIRIRILSASLLRPLRCFFCKTPTKNAEPPRAHDALLRQWIRCQGYNLSIEYHTEKSYWNMARLWTINEFNMFFPFRITQLVFLPRDFIWFLHFTCISAMALAI